MRVIHRLFQALFAAVILLAVSVIFMFLILALVKVTVML